MSFLNGSASARNRVIWEVQNAIFKRVEKYGKIQNELLTRGLDMDYVYVPTLVKDYFANFVWTGR